MPWTPTGIVSGGDINASIDEEFKFSVCPPRFYRRLNSFKNEIRALERVKILGHRTFKELWTAEAVADLLD